MDYGEILSNAWHTVWKHKALWLFGILGGCVGNGSPQINFRMNGGAQNMPPQMEHFFSQLQPWQYWALVAAIAVLSLVVIVFSIAAFAIGKSGVIRGTLMAANRSEPLSIGEVWQAAKPYFWRIVGLEVFIALILILFMLLIGTVSALFALATFGLGILCLIPFICLLVPAFWAASIVIEVAYTALVVDDLSVREALSTAWQVCTENLGEMLIMGLVLGLGGGILSVVIAAPVGIALAAIVGPIFLGNQQAINTGIMTGLLCLIPYLPVLLVASGILNAFISSAWTLTYTTLTGHSAGASTPEALPQGF